LNKRPWRENFYTFVE